MHLKTYVKGEPVHIAENTEIRIGIIYGNAITGDGCIHTCAQRETFFIHVQFLSAPERNLFIPPIFESDIYVF